MGSAGVGQQEGISRMRSAGGGRRGEKPGLGVKEEDARAEGVKKQ